MASGLIGAYLADRYSKWLWVLMAFGAVGLLAWIVKELVAIRRRGDW